MRCRVASETARLPLSAYDTVLGDTPERRAISPMFIELLRGTGAVDRGPFGGEMRRGSVESFRAKWKYEALSYAFADSYAVGFLRGLARVAEQSGQRLGVVADVG